MRPFSRIALATSAAALVALGTSTAAHADDDMASCPLHAQHMKDGEAAHLESVNKRGDKGMGFKQASTIHHFTLLSDGGAIDVSVTDNGDDESRQQIQQHLQHITKAFAAGDFKMPMFIHAQTPPGVPTMRRLKTRIGYAYAATPSGGRVTITTSDAKALAAVHSFLRFQIADHQTGDPATVQ
jgi:hypothetical protein